MLQELDVTKALPTQENRGLRTLDVSVVLAEGERGAGKRRILWTMVVVAGVVVLLVAAWLWWSGGFRSPTASFVTDTLVRGDIHVTLVATGTLQPTRDVSVVSNGTGMIASVDVDFNEPVVKGQALAHLDMSDLEARLARSRAMVDVQQANRLVAAASLADARAAAARAEVLAADDGVSQRDVDMARTAAQRAEANVASASAQLKAAQADLQTTLNDYARGTITSPIDGVVLDINVDPGQNIGTASLGQALFRVAADLSELNLELEIDEAEIARVSEGSRVSFTVEATPDRKFEGAIRQIRSAPTVSDGVVNYKALIAVNNSAMSLRTGMTATAEIAVSDAMDVLTVANGALRFSPDAAPSPGPFGGVIPKSTVETAASGNHTVWVLADDKLSPVSVVTGLTDGQRTQIISGALKEGDVVITGTQGH